MNLKQCDHHRLLISLILAAALLTELASAQKNSTKSKQRDKNTKKGSKESAPYYSFAAWNNRGKICLLVKLDASFKITYKASYGEQTLNHHLPLDAEMNGRCANVLDTESVMDITWKGGFIFRIVFQKYPKYDTWSVKKMELLYNTGDALFDGVVKGEEKIAKIENEFILSQFETPLGRSYLCPSPDVLYLQDSESGDKNVILRLTNIQMQAFDITAGKFSPVLRCGQVGFGLGVATPFGMQEGDSDGVQMTVFTVTILSSISTVLGYALYRSFFVKSYEYQEEAI